MSSVIVAAPPLSGERTQLLQSALPDLKESSSQVDVASA